MKLTEREQQVLFHVIDAFIGTGAPVSSGAVARRSEISVSSATVRNVLGSLEERGYLVQPHTSAGRVPTALGMRRYVDLLAEYGREHRVELATAELEDPPLEDPRAIARWAASLLAELSDLAGLMLGPNPRTRRVRDVRLVALDPRRVLSIFIDDDGSTVERVTTFDQPINPADLLPMQNYLSQLGRGLTLSELRARVRKELTDARGVYRRFMMQALVLAHEVGEEQRSDLHVEGAFRFVEMAENLERASALLHALERKELVIQILDQACETRTPIAVIGPESGWELANDLSFVLCGYYHGADQAGVVGVIGPMRMDYSRVFPLVDHVARVLSTELDAGP